MRILFKPTRQYPGNPGGALVNVNADLIGINTAIISGGGGNQGVGFAVPVNMARNVMDQILKHGKVTRGWLGVTVQPLNDGMAKAFGLTGPPRGALVGDVAPDSPAARSGLAKGDIILELNGEPVTDSRALSLKISALSPSTTVRLKISREGREREISVTLGELQSKTARAEENAVGGNGPRLGISVEPLTPQIARQLGLSPSTTGIVVDDVQPGSAAEEVGLHRGDLIQEVNRKTVSSIDEFQGAIRQAGNQPILLLIDRGGNHLFMLVEPR
jgi:S1-C subfamily serine protease